MIAMAASATKLSDRGRTERRRWSVDHPGTDSGSAADLCAEFDKARLADHPRHGQWWRQWRPHSIVSRFAICRPRSRGERWRADLAIRIHPLLRGHAVSLAGTGHRAPATCPSISAVLVPGQFDVHQAVFRRACTFATTACRVACVRQGQKWGSLGNHPLANGVPADATRGTRGGLA